MEVGNRGQGVRGIVKGRRGGEGAESDVLLTKVSFCSVVSLCS